MEHQNWEPVVFRKTGTATQGTLGKRPRDSNAPANQHARALEESTEVKKPKSVAPESRTELVKARLARGFTQDQADAACALPKHTFKAIESGQLTPNGSILSKISREFGVNLRLA
jgi:ribosome-binding protein aMBF1 (putative translation factor)